ncbi:3'-5' exonuclease [Micromonospora sp. CPCC 206061]|uniref:3'-5' exonuclease n=1 Tax=Micromonospora sp. CPCC 206061 TaxID=3122410 RepID=UPI002FF3C32F
MAVDVEDNGQQPPRLVELAVVPIDAGVIGDPVSWLVRPPSPITWQATKVHGITDQDVVELPGIAAVEADIREYLDGAVLVAHNARIDIDVLARELPSWQPAAVIDTLRLARARLPRQASYRLGVLVRTLRLDEDLPLGLRPRRAAYDALVAARLLVHLAASTGGDPPRLGDLVGAAPTSSPDQLF